MSNTDFFALNVGGLSSERDQRSLAVDGRQDTRAAEIEEAVLRP